MKIKLLILIFLFIGSGILVSNPIIYPKAGIKICKDKQYTIKWDSNFFFSKDNVVKIVLYKGNMRMVRVLVDSTTNDGNFSKVDV